jgi:hypothetical protein
MEALFLPMNLFKKFVIGTFLVAAALPALAATNAGTTGNGPGDVTTYGVYPSSTPSLAPNQKAPLRFDQNGNLDVNVQVGGGGGGGGSGAVYPAPGASAFPVVETATVPVSIVGSSGSGTGNLGFVSLSAGSNSIGSVSLNAGSNTIGTVNAGIGFPSLSSAGTPATGANVVTVQGNSSGVPIPVSGAFYPAVQPISAASAIPVTGTFFQATQPVSIAATVNVNCVSGCGTGGSGGSLAAQYNPTPPAYSAATSAPLQLDASGNLKTSQQTPNLLVVASSLPMNLFNSSTGNEANIGLPNTTAPSSSQKGLSTVGQDYGFDGAYSSSWYPNSTDEYSGVQNVTTGGIYTNYYTAGSSGGDPVSTIPARLVKIYNTSLTTQPNMICYNNASTASGSILWQGALGGAGSATDAKQPDVWATNGIFCQPASAINSGTGGIVIEYD